MISALNQKADGTPYPGALLDVGLAAHPIGGMVHDEMRKVLDLADNLDPIMAMTIGKRADASVLEGPAYEREIAPRVRLELDEIVLHGKP